MRGLIRFAVVCLAGALIGLISAQQIIAGAFGLIADSRGPWRVWVGAGLPKVDPYTRAHYILEGRISMGAFETLEYEARVDDSGSALNADCTYAVSGPAQKARWWSLAALPQDGTQLPPEDAERIGLVAQRVIYEADGSFRAALARELQPGNWFRPAGNGPLVLLYRLYGADASLRSSPLSAELPRIEREVCR